MDKSRRVVVTGLGAVTSIGTNVADFWSALLEGTCGIRPFSLFDPSGYRTQTAAQVLEIPDGFLSHAERKRTSRADRMGLAAAREAIAQSGLDLAREDPTRIGVILGGGTSGLLDSEAYYEQHLHGKKGRPSHVLNHLPDAITDRVAQRFKVEGLKSTITTACSSSANAMGFAHDVIAAGLADVVITGGSDVLARLTYGGFNSLRSVDPEPCRPFDRERRGLSIGEAAGILVFEEWERARRRGAPILAEFLGYGVTSDAYHMTAPDPTGAAGGRTVRSALAAAGVNADDVDYVNAHGTATPQNDSAETAALKMGLGDRARNVPISSIKSMIGHCLCASGAIEAVATVLTVRDGKIPPTIHYDNPDPACDLDYVPNAAREGRVDVALSDSFAFGGNSSVVVFAREAGVY
ncbi:MAG: beta-ketoacyl-[acyl-carrier-protein] synthase family protein [Acidobacteria bacterium]|nr:beta-ketoacyl-[acyl-carrier-protein] synthase family protein [Acidobacteriota bacterium]MCA1610748.1 beta-ketoacyl-[acyl-carrier-protein] synthase family protein [Acidobacteriota bacterium]